MKEHKQIVGPVYVYTGMYLTVEPAETIRILIDKETGKPFAQFPIEPVGERKRGRQKRPPKYYRRKREAIIEKIDKIKKLEPKKKREIVN